MISIFNGNMRKLGAGTRTEIYAKIDVEMRDYLYHFKGAKMLVFLSISLHADANGEAYPSLKQIERETGYNEETIQIALNDLCKLTINGHRVLAKINRRGDGNRFMSNLYQIFPLSENPVSESPVSDSSIPENAGSKYNQERKENHLKESHIKEEPSDSFARSANGEEKQMRPFANIVTDPSMSPDTVKIRSGAQEVSIINLSPPSLQSAPLSENTSKLGGHTVPLNASTVGGHTVKRSWSNKPGAAIPHTSDVNRFRSDAGTPQASLPGMPQTGLNGAQKRQNNKSVIACTPEQKLQNILDKPMPTATNPAALYEWAFASTYGELPGIEYAYVNKRLLPIVNKIGGDVFTRRLLAFMADENARTYGGHSWEQFLKTHTKYAGRTMPVQKRSSFETKADRERKAAEEGSQIWQEAERQGLV